MLRGLTVGIDIGGTKVAAGVVDADGTVLDGLRQETPSSDPAATERLIVDIVEGFRERFEIEAVGIGAAGFIDVSQSIVLFSPHLAWRNEPLRAVLETRLALPVVVENDANAAGWAEWRFGAAIGEAVALCVNLGTGIGGAMVVDGELWRGGWGMAGEFGHLVVVPNGRACACGNHGCWEQYASGNALVRAARERAAAEPREAQALLARVSGDVGAITGLVVMGAAQDADATAVQAFRDVGWWLGLGLANLAAAFDPTLIVIGGGVSEASELLLESARASYAENLTGRGYRPLAGIVAARLGNDAGFIGAADLARNRFDPRASVSPAPSR